MAESNGASMRIQLPHVDPQSVDYGEHLGGKRLVQFDYVDVG
jgi:hypothetical protein